MGKSVSFQHIVRGKSKESLAYDDGQKQEEMEKDIKKSSGGLEEAEKRTIEDFLSHVEDLEQQEDLIIESSNDIMRSCGFKIDKYV